MKTRIHISEIALCAAVLGSGLVHAATNSFVASNDVTWTTLGQNENDSMPIGNGDLAANVWTEQNGDLILLVSKSDAWTEMGKLVKLGRVRVHLTPNSFLSARNFTQTLRLEDGSIEIKNGDNVLVVWVDANHPIIHIEANLSQPAVLEANLEIWRTQMHSYESHSPDKGGLFEFGNHNVPVDFEADTVLPTSGNRLRWYHFNAASIYPLVLEQEHLQQDIAKYPDPLLHRCFGAALFGPGLVSKDDHSLVLAAPSRKLRLDLVGSPSRMPFRHKRGSLASIT